MSLNIRELLGYLAALISGDKNFNFELKVQTQLHKVRETVTPNLHSLSKVRIWQTNQQMWCLLVVVNDVLEQKLIIYCRSNFAPMCDTASLLIRCPGWRPGPLIGQVNYPNVRWLVALSLSSLCSNPVLLCSSLSSLSPLSPGLCVYQKGLDVNQEKNQHHGQRTTYDDTQGLWPTQRTQIQPLLETEPQNQPTNRHLYRRRY